MSEAVFDLDAVVAEASGEEREPFKFTHGGDEYEFPADFPLLALAAISAGELGDGLRILLGAEQWQRMLRSEANLDGAKFKALFDAYAAHTGSTLGESSASTGSSKSTEGPLKLTSNGSTGSRSQTSSPDAALGAASAS